MSKQKGIIKLEGNLGGISFYSAEGQYLARVASGPSKERIATDPNFRRTRENNKEFGGSAKAAKALRLAMGALVQNIASKGLVSKLTAIFKAINLKTVGIRGKRAIQLSANKDMLKNVEFNSKLSLSTVFSLPVTNTVNIDRNETTLVVPAFSPDNSIKAPAGATHFKLVSGIGVVSDYVHNDGTSSYEAIISDQDQLGASNSTVFLALSGNTPAQTIKTTIPGGIKIDAQCSLVQVLGIEFYQKVGADYYLFAQDRALKVINVF